MNAAKEQRALAQIPSFAFWANLMKFGKRQKIPTKTKLDLELILNPLFLPFSNLLLMPPPHLCKKKTHLYKPLKSQLQPQQSM